MPQQQGAGQKQGEGEQPKYPQQNFQFPMTMPTAFPDYYAHDNKQQKHGGHYDNTGAFFNFSSNEVFNFLLS